MGVGAERARSLEGHRQNTAAAARSDGSRSAGPVPDEYQPAGM